MARSENLKTPLCRFAYTQHLFKLKKDDNGKESWNCTLLFPKDADLSALKELALAAAKEEWGDKAVQMLKDGLIYNPFLDGDGPQGKNKQTGEAHRGFPGTTFLRVQSGKDFRPKLVDNNVLPIASQEDFYSGCYGYAVVNAFTWENKEKGKGISFGISMAQKTREGEKLGGGEANPEQYFQKEAVDDAGAAPASTKSGAGAAGLFG